MKQRRRQGRGFLAVAAGIALVVAACGSGGGSGGSDAGSGAPGPSGEPKRGGTLRYGLEAETDGLNPTTNRFAIAAYMMGNAVFDRLAYVDENDEIKPFLAESWTPSADSTSWEVKLRPGIEFHDGTPLTSEAVQLAFEQALADPLVGIAAKPILAAENPVEIVDDLTVRFNMAGPNTHLPVYLASQLGFIGSPTWLRAAEENPDLNQQPVGTGPFEFESRTQDSSTTFVRNDDWWGGEVYLDGIEFVIQTDPARRADQLLAGDLDVLHTSTPSAINLLRGESGIALDEEELGEESFAMINTQATPFDDVRVRKALTLATPKQKYLEVIGEGILTPADSMFHPDLPWHNPDVRQEADDPDGAKKLAREYCAEQPSNCEGDRIKMTYKYTGPSVEQDLTADVLIDGWEDAFVVEREQVLQDDYIIGVALGEYQVVGWRQFGSIDPEGEFIFLDCRSIGGISLNWPRNCNQDTQDALLVQRGSADEAEQVEAWKTVAEEINSDYLYVFLYHTRWLLAARDDVGNLTDQELPDGSRTAFRNGGQLVADLWLDR